MRDCTCVAFSSDATNLVPDDTNRRPTSSSATCRADDDPGQSSASTASAANGASSFTSVPRLTARPGRVPFGGDQSRRRRYQRGLRRLRLRSGIRVRRRASASVPVASRPTVRASLPRISADGRCVAFASAATNLLPVPGPGAPDTNGTLDIYVECDGVVTCRASVSSDGAEANDISFLPAAERRRHHRRLQVERHQSRAGRLAISSPTCSCTTAAHGETARASVGDDGQEGNDIAIPPSISGDGRFVAFGSFASNLLPGRQHEGFSQVYVRDLVSNTTSLISTALAGQPGQRRRAGSAAEHQPRRRLGRIRDRWPTISCRGDNQGYLDAFIRANVHGGADGDADRDAGRPTRRRPGRFPATRYGDCPVGQVCGPDDVCVPAPTPTPTIVCDDDEECPAGLFCVDGVCRDLSTPTATPTPLPTCVTDEDCPDDVRLTALCVPRLRLRAAAALR